MVNPPHQLHKVLVVPPLLLQEEIGPSFLDRSQFRVRTAANGKDAVAIAAAWQPAVLLFSSRLPDMTASQLVESIRSRIGDSAKLILLTDSVEIAAAGTLDADLDAHLVTPFVPEQILATLAAVLDVNVRRAPRAQVRILARVETETTESSPAQPAALSTILDISETGLRVECPRNMSIGDKGRVHFALPGLAKKLSLPFVVRVVVDEVKAHYGVAFVFDDGAADGQQHELIRSFVGERLVASKGKGSLPETG
ncbi:MAG: PilZ domain-containing protein [Pseudomonadota bacterium]